MDRTEYESLRQQVEDDYRQNLDALERVWKLTQQADQTQQVVATAQSTTQAKRKPVIRHKNGNSITNRVKRIVEKQDAEFDLRSIHEILLLQHPSLSETKVITIRQILRGLVADGKIVVVQPNKGRRPAKYVTQQVKAKRDSM